MKTKTTVIESQFTAAGGLKAAMIGALALFAVSTMVHATVTPIGIGATVTPSSNVWLGGTLVGTASGSFSTNGALGVNGNYKEWVYKEGGGTLDFYYQFGVTSVGLGGEAISQVTTEFFSPVATLTVGVFYNTDGLSGSGLTLGTAPAIPAAGGVVPTDFHRDGSGSVLNMNFGGGGVGVNQDSAILGIQTNATVFGSGSVAFQDGGNSGNLAALVPVPEPASTVFGFALLGVVGAAGWKRVSALKMPGFAF